jgi:hypothetical protein
MRDALTIALAQFPGIWVSAAIPPAREFFALSLRDRGFDHSEPEISITCRVFGCGFGRPRRRPRSGDFRDPPTKGRGTAPVETLTND